MKRNLLFYLLLIPFFSLSQTWTNFTTINTTSEIQGNFCNIISGNGKTWVTSYKNKGLFYLENNIWSHFPQLDSFNVRILGLDNQKNPWFIKSDDHGHYILFKVMDNVIVEYGDYGSLSNVTLGKNDDAWILDFSQLLHIKNNDAIEKFNIPEEFVVNRRSKLAVLDNNELWCYGSKRIADNEQCPPVYEYKKMILRYDGTQWTNLRDSTVFDKNIDFQNIAVFQNKIWLRSDKELFTFDGTSWHMIDIDPLQDLTILKILPTNDYFWVLTDTGLYKYDGTSWQLIDLNLPDFPYIYNTFNLLADGDNLWIGYEKGIIKYNASNTEYFGSEHDIYICNSLHKTSNGDIWFTSYSDGGNIVADIIQYSNGSFTKQGVLNNRLYDRISVSDDKMWFFKKGYGISQFNNNQWTFYSATGLSDNLIKDINQDKAGNILISTRSGINSYNKAVNSWRTLTHQPNSKFFNDNNNKIWMYRNQLQSIDEDENIQDEELIIQDEAISNIKSVFDFFQDENGVYYMIADMPYYKDGNSWVTFKPGISWFSLTSGVKKDDLLFVGSKKQGIIILGGQSIEWEKTTDISKNVSDLLKDSNNRIWCTRIDQYIDQDQCGLTYVDGGISVLDGDEWTYFTDLPIMDAFCIMEDNLGRIWFGTEKGVFVYAFGEWHNYNKDNSGLLSNKITTIFQDENNDIWIGTTVGITKIEDPNLLSMRIVKTENIDQIKWAIAPNPAQNFITINNSQSGNLSIVNSLGIQVYAYENFQGGNIDIHQLNPGLYFVGLEINNTISYQKLIIK